MHVVAVAAVRTVALALLLSPPLFSLKYLSDPSTAYVFVFVLAMLLLTSTLWSYAVGDPAFKHQAAADLVLLGALALYHWGVVDQGVFVVLVGALGVVCAIGFVFIANFMGKPRSKRAGYACNIVALASPVVAAALGAAVHRTGYEAGLMVSLAASGANLIFNKAP